MAFLDEKIITQRLEKRQQSHRNIYDEEVYAGSEILHFSPVKLFEGKMQLMLPDHFTDMSPLLAEVKYPSTQRPQIIKTNENGAVNFCFNLFESPIEKEDIEATVLKFQSALQRAQPSLLQYEQKTEHLVKTEISWFDFQSFSLDKPIYNLIFVTSFGGKLMNGTLNCPKNLQDAWAPIMKQVVASIEDHAKEASK